MRRVYLDRYCPIILLLLAVICGNAYALQGSTGVNGSDAQAVHELYNITGRGIKVGLITARNALAAHIAFEPNTVFNYDYSGAGIGYNYHDTPFAGIIKSKGSYNHPYDIGVAPGVEIHCCRIANDSDNVNRIWLQNALDDLMAIGCKVIVTGFQWPPDYDPNWSRMYDYYAANYDVVFANAAGNQTTSFSNISIFGDGYNGITTGGLEEPVTDNYSRVGNITCLGPTIDGRRKPEVMAPSTSQIAPGYSSTSNNYWYTTSSTGATSWAVPHTAGVAALLLEDANQTAEPDDSHNEVIKAVIVNSAFPNIDAENGNPTNPADSNNTWHNERGYGRVDALRAINTLSAGKVSKDTAVIASAAGWAYDTINPSAAHTYLIAGNKNERLVLTVTWNCAITKSDNYYYSLQSPLFNLDVTVKNPDGEPVFSEADDVNNLEKVDILLPADGNYTVSLSNNTSKSGNYGLAFELLAPLTGDFNIDYIVDGYDLGRIAEEWLTAGVKADIVPDNIVNNLDFAEFADNWLKTDKRYFCP